MKPGVYLESGQRRIFACALDWPGWARAARSQELALEALAAYAARYAVVAERADQTLPELAGDSNEAFDVVARLTGTATTDFGAPDLVPDQDRVPTDGAEAARLAALVEAAWQTFDRVVGAAPAVLVKGPRGGGRDRDAIVQHVVDSEIGYARKIGVKHRSPAPDDALDTVTGLRRDIVAVLGKAADAAPLAERGWPLRYAARRIAWHVLDHAWEIEDRSIG